jgi:hypothetical protein
MEWMAVVRRHLGVEPVGFLPPGDRQRGPVRAGAGRIDLANDRDRHLTRRAWAAAVLGVICLASTLVSAPAHVATVSVRPSLDNLRVDFGLANQPADLGWMTASHVPWRYRYAYLSGGVNTGTGWETWNSPSGAYATNYQNSSLFYGYLPVFTYYELLQSHPSTGTNESDRDYSNLNNDATMAAYYANFKLLMQSVGGFLKTAIVHVEPDLWGYLQQRSAGGTVALTASVQKSGFPDVSGFPDTVPGFMQALQHIRDLYAPSVYLAAHASGWATGVDIDSSTDPTINATQVGSSTGAFLGTGWDLIFNDLDDHDAGWWEQQGKDNANFTHWWDPTNVKFPNFTRYLAWVAALHNQTALPQFAWQVPVGNQWYKTMNNTCGHYQDNVAAYFLVHTADLYAAGMIGVLFGSGNSCQTNYNDVRRDGITNNGGAPITDTLGNCNKCNTHVSQWPDDDGGLLRVMAGNYYEIGNWAPLGGILTSGPDASSSSGPTTNVFVRGSDNALWYRGWDGVEWGPWQSLGGILTSDPTAVSWGPNHIDVFVRGSDNQLYQRTWGATGWQPWKALGGILTSGPDVTSQGANSLDVFVSGTDNGLWQRSWNGTSWGAWKPLGGTLTSDPSAVSWGPGHIDVFARGIDNGLWQRTWNGTAWGAWTSLGGTLRSAPDAASCTAGHMDVWVVGSDNQVTHISFTGTGWSSWGSGEGFATTSSPSAVCRAGTNREEIFARGWNNDALWHDVVMAS